MGYYIYILQLAKVRGQLHPDIVERVAGLLVKMINRANQVVFWENRGVSTCDNGVSLAQRRGLRNELERGVFRIAAIPAQVAARRETTCQEPCAPRSAGLLANR